MITAPNYEFRLHHRSMGTICELNISNDIFGSRLLIKESRNRMNKNMHREIKTENRSAGQPTNISHQPAMCVCAAFVWIISVYLHLRFYNWTNEKKKKSTETINQLSMLHLAILVLLCDYRSEWLSWAHHHSSWQSVNSIFQIEINIYRT